jgi:hypothetical protein
MVSTRRTTLRSLRSVACRFRQAISGGSYFPARGDCRGRAVEGEVAHRGGLRLGPVEPGAVERCVRELDIIRRGPVPDPAVGFGQLVRTEVVQHEADPDLGRVQRAQAAAEGQKLGASPFDPAARRRPAERSAAAGTALRGTLIGFGPNVSLLSSGRARARSGGITLSARCVPVHHSGAPHRLDRRRPFERAATQLTTAACLIRVARSLAR